MLTAFGPVEEAGERSLKPQFTHIKIAVYTDKQKKWNTMQPLLQSMHACNQTNIKANAPVATPTTSKIEVWFPQTWYSGNMT